MKELLDTPTMHSDPTEIADYAELQALKVADRTVSRQDIIEDLKRFEDDIDETYEAVVDDALQELSMRQEHMGAYGESYYPYSVDGDLLTARKPRKAKEHGWLYIFLLLATRGNMNKDARQVVPGGGTIDGTRLFEHMCFAVAKSYWGGAADHRVDGIVFGTAKYDGGGTPESKPPGFAAAIESLCAKWGEGTQFHPKEECRISAKDDRVDIIVWRSFSDKRRGKLTGFGQCKTGTTWGRELPRLRPGAFCQKWLHDMPALAPVPLFFLSERVVSDWYNSCCDAGVVFDRCRILDYSDSVPREILQDATAWSRAVLHKNKLEW